MFILCCRCGSDNMERIQDTIQQVIGNLAAKKGDQDIKHPREIIKKLLTKKELAHIKVTNFYKGILYVDVDSSSWLYALTLRKKSFLEELKEAVPPIADIRFRIGDRT